MFILLFLIVIFIVIFTSSQNSNQGRVESKQKVLKTAHYDIAGIYYHQENLEKIVEINPLFSAKRNDVIAQADKLLDKQIFKYDYKNPYNARLIPEPTNPEDPNAIQIVVNDCHIGYIRRRVTSPMSDIMSAEIVSCTCKIHGGKYKILRYDSETGKYSLTSHDEHFGGQLTVQYYIWA